MRASGRATISDVAAASGVGVGTVSRVINGAANVREATRQTVLRVIEQLGYRPSHLAASLSRGTARTVAIVVPHLTRPSTVERLAGALAVLNGQGYDTVVCNVETPAQRDHCLARLTARHRADGVIVMSVQLGRKQLAAFRRAGVPLATVDVSAPGIPHTVTDDIAGGRLATAHLLALGHRRIAFVGDSAVRADVSLGFSSSRRRLEGYRRELGAAAADLAPELVRLGPHGPSRGGAIWPLSCWPCPNRLPRSSPRRTPRRWGCCRPPSKRASACLAPCRWSASMMSRRRRWSGSVPCASRCGSAGPRRLAGSAR